MLIRLMMNHIVNRMYLPHPVLYYRLVFGRMGRSKNPTGDDSMKTQSGRNRLATDQVIDALSDLGRLETVDAALVAAARSLADAVDSAPDNASLWREYRAALAELRAVGGEVDDELFSTLASLRTEVRHPENAQSPKPG